MLSSVEFANNGALTHIGNWAFYNCHELTELAIPEGVTEIGHAAFYGCTYLTELTLPSSVQKIAENGFALCSKLKAMHIKAAVPPTIQAKTFFDVNRQIPVYIPTASTEAYENDPFWREFNIQSENEAPAAVDNIQSPNNNSQKLLHNGQLLIIRNGKTYSMMGQEMQYIVLF